MKQYSLDVFLVLALVSVPDAFFGRSLGRNGRDPGRVRGLLLLLLPTLFSYVYGVALLARVSGWYAWRVQSRGWRLDWRVTAFAGAGLAAALGVLWLTDIRYTMGQPGLFADSGAVFDPLAEEGLASRLSINALVDPARGGEGWRMRDGLGAIMPGNAGDAQLLNALADALTSGRTPN